jgi:GDP-L-fucose synthase
MDKSSKIYIAGHTGLVGSSILRNFKSKAYNNFVFTPYPEYDLTNQSATAEFFKKEKPEYVILAAAKVGGIVANNTYRAQFIYENLQIQNNIIHQSYLNGVKKLLFLGSSCIYPKACPQPMKEDYLLTDILEYTNEPYAIAKIAGIKLIESYNIQYGTNYIAVMPTNLYGYNDNFDLEKSHVLPAIIRKMYLGKCLMNNDMDSVRQNLKRNPIENVVESSSDNEILDILNKYGITKNSILLWGSGNPKREFLHADDLADACTFLMENVDYADIIKSKFGIAKISSPPELEIRNTHINIGTGKDLTINDLAYLIKNIVGYQGSINWDSSKPDGTFQKLLDVSKLHDLGWKEKIELEEGISKVFANYIQNS